MTLALHYALRSDVGLLREGNEDSAYAGPGLLAIADGMGGHAAGEVASAVAIAAISPLDGQHLTDGEAMLDALATAVAAARDTLHEMSLAQPAVEGMGTTLTALLWAGGQVAVCHIGDSRAYLLRDGDLYQITRDHTLIQGLVDEGRLTPEAAANHPQRSLIMRALQGNTEAEPDLAMHEALLRDRYLLCSDGLTDVVADKAVHEVLSTVADPAQAVDLLIELAIRNGGPDNITCVVADVIEDGGPLPPSGRHAVAGAAAGGDPQALLAAAAGYAGAPAPSAEDNGAGGTGLHDVTSLSYDEPKRRWPVVSSVLVVLVLVVVCGLYFGWRATQGQYYLARDGSQVSIYRGINQKIAFISLSSVYQRTGVPVAQVPGDLSLPTPPGPLSRTQATLTSIRRSYTCKQKAGQLQAWTARYGTPAPATRTSAAPKTRTSAAPKTRTSPAPAASPATTPARPVVPAYCQALGTG